MDYKLLMGMLLDNNTSFSNTRIQHTVEQLHAPTFSQPNRPTIQTTEVPNANQCDMASDWQYKEVKQQDITANCPNSKEGLHSNVAFDLLHLYFA